MITVNAGLKICWQSTSIFTYLKLNWYFIRLLWAHASSKTVMSIWGRLFYNFGQPAIWQNNQCHWSISAGFHCITDIHVEYYYSMIIIILTVLPGSPAMIPTSNSRCNNSMLAHHLNLGRYPALRALITLMSPGCFSWNETNTSLQWTLSCPILILYYV